jgi:type IV pilus assembly protein PilA
MMRWLMRKSHNKKGFTLVELMVVIAVIGVLAAIAVPQFNAYRMSSYKSACISDGKNAYNAAMNWFAANTCDH